MRKSRAVIFGLIPVLALALSACGDPGLRQLSSSGNGPDEFRVVPNKPLSTPPSYAELPAPTPGGQNRTDLDPIGDAVAALGGRRQSVGSTKISSSDAALVTYSGRKGRTSDIRETLATEDAAFRHNRGRFSSLRIVKQDRYNEAYKDQHLNQYREQERWRRGGAATPASPPLN